jgi:hypothetical protein
LQAGVRGDGGNGYVICNSSSSARTEKVAFTLPNVFYQVWLPAIWIGVSECCSGVTFSFTHSKTSSFFILYQKSLPVFSTIYAPVILDLLRTFVNVSVFLQWRLVNMTIQMVEFGLEVELE